MNIELNCVLTEFHRKAEGAVGTFVSIVAINDPSK